MRAQATIIETAVMTPWKASVLDNGTQTAALLRTAATQVDKQANMLTALGVTP